MVVDEFIDGELEIIMMSDVIAIAIAIVVGICSVRSNGMYSKQ